MMSVGELHSVPPFRSLMMAKIAQQEFQVAMSFAIDVNILLYASDTDVRDPLAGDPTKT